MDDLAKMSRTLKKHEDSELCKSAQLGNTGPVVYRVNEGYPSKTASLSRTQLPKKDRFRVGLTTVSLGALSPVTHIPIEPCSGHRTVWLRVMEIRTKERLLRPTFRQKRPANAVWHSVKSCDGLKGKSSAILRLIYESSLLKLREPRDALPLLEHGLSR